ncbi:MAG TPA: hypothetical protein VJ456_07790 [Acidimicrobiia bacterium]|nr:hypothetical protein [Acidimicrobiia bacterium]
MRRHALLITVPVCAAALVLGPVAARADVVPAPPGSASAVAAQVGSLLDISKTGATADSGAPSADASVVRLGGQPLLGLGGTQSGDGEAAGSLLDTGTSLPARVQVAPWHAEADGTHGPTRHAQGSAALARADAEKVANVGVLTSDSEASHTDQKSTGQAVTNGFELNILDAISVVLLHSEVSSEGRGHSYLVGLNGTEIGTDDQLGTSPLCALNAPNLLSLSCLTGSGGNGAAGGVTSGAAQVVDITPAAPVLADLPVAAFTAAASSGTGQTPAVTPPEAAPATAVSANETSRAIAAPVEAASARVNPGGAALPRTGTPAASLAVGAFAMVLLGFALRRFRIRPSTH